MINFELRKNNTNVQREFFGGLSAFLASFYIILVNPIILSNAGLPFSAVSTATVLIAAFSTIMMGLYANNPIVLAPGMGLNAFFAFSVVVGMRLTPEVALGIVFWSGIIFLLLSIFNVREKIVELIPIDLRHAIACGIGLFIAFIGLINGGVIIKHPATLVQMAPISPITATFLAGLLFTSILVVKKYKAALVIGILLTLALAYPIGRLYGDASTLTAGSDTLITYKGMFSLPDFSLFLKLDLLNSLKLSLVPVMFSFVFTDLFDTLSTLVGVCDAGDLLDEDGKPRNLKKSLIVDAAATTLSALVGSSPTTSFVESAAGVQQGSRTGLSAIFSGLLFLPFLFLAPLLSMFPSFVAAPALVVVGAFMINPISKINWKDLNVAIPCFLAIILIPLTFSISQGIVWGLLVHYTLYFYQKIRP